MSSNLRYDTIYKPVQSTWYKQAPYTFKFNGKNNDVKYFNLPISPSNLSITTHFATNVVATMYGTIEEHSEQRYFDINISGTTGIGPKYYMATDLPDSAGDKASVVRDGYTTKTSLIKTGDYLAAIARRTKDLINKALDQVSEINSENSSIQSGIFDDANGYMAFHNFYRFLLDYKKKAANGELSSDHPLQFINYKDNNQYDVSITNFQLMRDQRSPMLYNYSISMRAYNLKNADESKLVSGLNLADLGLGNIDTPVFAKLSNAARKVKNAAYATVAAAKGLGK